MRVSGQFSLNMINGVEEEVGSLGWILTYFVLDMGKSVWNLHSYISSWDRSSLFSTQIVWDDTSPFFPATL